MASARNILVVAGLFLFLAVVSAAPAKKDDVSAVASSEGQAVQSTGGGHGSSASGSALVGSVETGASDGHFSGNNVFSESIIQGGVAGAVEGVEVGIAGGGGSDQGVGNAAANASGVGPSAESNSSGSGGTNGSANTWGAASVAAGDSKKQ